MSPLPQRPDTCLFQHCSAAASHKSILWTPDLCLCRLSSRTGNAVTQCKVRELKFQAPLSISFHPRFSPSSFPSSAHTHTLTLAGLVMGLQI